MGGSDVLLLSAASFLVGAALAQRFTVLILVPAVLAVLMLSLGVGVAEAPTAWSVVATAATIATSMQIGYLIGISIHDAVAAAASRSAPSASARQTVR
jgi:hypothetical protein